MRDQPPQLAQSSLIKVNTPDIYSLKPLKSDKGLKLRHNPITPKIQFQLKLPNFLNDAI